MVKHRSVLFSLLELVTMLGGMERSLVAVGESHDLAHDGHV